MKINWQELVDQSFEKVNKEMKSLISDDNENNFFLTEHGQSFKKKFEDLSLFIIITGGLIYGFPSFLRLIYNPAFPDALQNMLELQQKDKKIDNTEELNQAAILIDLLKYTKNEPDEKNADNKEMSLLIKEIRILERIVSYYILSLYAYAEVFINDSYEFITSKLESKYVKVIVENFLKSNHLVEKVNNILKGIDNKLFECVKNKLLGEEGYMKAFNLLMGKGKEGLRNIIAHKNPIYEIEKIKKRFSSHYQDSIELVEYLEKMANESIPITGQKFKELLTQSIKSFFDEMRIPIFIVNVGFQCFRYLALIDQILYSIVNA